MMLSRKHYRSIVPFFKVGRLNFKQRTEGLLHCSTIRNVRFVNIDDLSETLPSNITWDNILMKMSVIPCDVIDIFE